MTTSSCSLCTGSHLDVPWLGGYYHQNCRKNLEDWSQEFLKYIALLLATPFEQTPHQYQYYNEAYQAALDALSEEHFSSWNKDEIQTNLMVKGWEAVKEYVTNRGLVSSKDELPSNIKDLSEYTITFNNN